MKITLQSLRVAVVAMLIGVTIFSGGSAWAQGTCDYNAFLDHLKLREGVRKCVYRDSLGKPTVGVGHLVKPGDNLSVGDCISDAQVDTFLQQDAQGAWNAAQSQAAALGCNDPCFTLALASVNYQLGTGWRSKFPSTWQKMQSGDYTGAADGLESSLWNRQTPTRVDDFQAALRAVGNNCTGQASPPPTGGGGGGGGGPSIPPTGGTDLGDYPNNCGTCGCSKSQSEATVAYIENQHARTREFITEQFKIHEDWIFGSNRNFMGKHDSFFELHMLPALMMMTEQLVTTGMEQMLILGTFFDAKIQMETQRLFQEKAAEAHRDYQPAMTMCTIGTTVRGLASADRNGEFTSFLLSQRSQDRQLGMYNTNAAHSAGIDREGRIRQVKERYCDMDDNSGDLEELCEAGESKPETVNRDIDFTRTVDLPRTLNIDFNDATLTNDEQDVLALGSNLFSYEVLDKQNRAAGGLEETEGAYLEMRSIIAKRSIAENSFNTIVGMKTAGTEASEKTIPFTEKILEQMGIADENERRLLIGGTKDDGKEAALRPSYYAQLEILAQKIYQDPEFYTNLYDKPANVLRKQVAMQAINLMLERDMYKNEQRSEMVMSVWLEMELMKYQKDVQNRLNAMKEGYEQN